MEPILILLLICIIFSLIYYIFMIEVNIQKEKEEVIEYYPEHSFLLLIDSITSIKILFISNRDVDANNFLKNVTKINVSDFSFVQKKILYDEILNLKRLLISLNRFRSIQSENIEYLLTELTKVEY